MRTSIDTLLHARWIIPVDAARSVLDHHCLAIDQGRIVDILPSSEARTRYDASEERHQPHHALLPGLINSHTHAAMSLFRGLSDDLPLMSWLEEHIWPAEARWVDPGFVRDGTTLAVAEMIRSGTTCFNDMYFFPDHTAEVASAIGIRAMVGLIVIDFPTAWAANADEYFHKGLAVHDSYRSHPLVHTAFAPHAPYTVSDAPLQRITTLVEELDIPVHMHVHETAFEVDSASQQFGQRPLARLQNLGLLSPRLMAVHMTQLDETEITLCRDFNLNVVHCPQSNLKLASGFCPVHQLQNAGVNVALGTDGAASNNDLDMWGELQTAALLAKAVGNDATALPAYEALAMATINGARALGLDETTGSLEIGKSADLITVDLSALECQPLYDPVSQLVYAGGRDLVTDVRVAGKELMRDRQLAGIDTEVLRQRLGDWQQKICSQ